MAVRITLSSPFTTNPYKVKLGQRLESQRFSSLKVDYKKTLAEFLYSVVKVLRIN